MAVAVGHSDECRVPQARRPHCRGLRAAAQAAWPLFISFVGSLSGYLWAGSSRSSGGPPNGWPMLRRDSWSWRDRTTCPDGRTGWARH